MQMVGEQPSLSMRVVTSHQPSFLINEHRGGNFDNVERVAHVQLPGAVAYIVFAARGEANFARHVAALSEAVESLRYRPEFINWPDGG
jgi:hypothetical protein